MEILYNNMYDIYYIEIDLYPQKISIQMCSIIKPSTKLYIKIQKE